MVRSGDLGGQLTSSCREINFCRNKRFKRIIVSLAVWLFLSRSPSCWYQMFLKCIFSQMRFKKSTDHISISFSINGHSITHVVFEKNMVRRFHQPSHRTTFCECKGFLTNYLSCCCSQIRQICLFTHPDRWKWASSLIIQFLRTSVLSLMIFNIPCFFRMHCEQIWFHILLLLTYIRLCI